MASLPGGICVSGGGGALPAGRLIPVPSERWTSSRDSSLKTEEHNERWHVPWRRRVGRMETVGLAPAGLGLNPRRTQGRGNEGCRYVGS